MDLDWILVGAVILRFNSVKPELERVRSEFRQRELVIARVSEESTPL